MRLWWRLFPYVRGMLPLVFLSLLFLIGAKIAEVIVPLRLGQLMQEVLGGGVLSDVLRGTIVVGLIFLAAYVLDAINVVLMSQIGQRAVFRLRTSLFEHLQKLDISFYDGQRVGQLMSRAIADVQRIQAGFSEALISMFGNVVLLVCITAGMYIADWRIALIVTAVFPFIVGLTWRFGRVQRTCYREVRSTLGTINTFMQEHLMGARIIRNFGLERSERQKFDGANEGYRQANLKTIHYFAQFFASIEWLQNFVLAVTFVGLVLFGLRGQPFEAGVFFTFNLYLMTFFRPLRDLSDRYNVFQDALASAERVFQLFDAEPEVVGPTQPLRLETIESIQFEDVWFAYEQEQWVLKGVTFEITRGQSVALVGETGAGKTTILSLLNRFYDVIRGSIRINGRDIRDYPLDELRRHFSLVLQDPVLFSGTISENVALFEPMAAERVTEALHYVGALDFVQRLPGGIAAPLEEQGKGLSSGEKQLLSLARAVAHSGDLIMLDEATSNIDTLTEKLIQEALAKLLSARTSLIIAHRLSTILASDLILVLHAGEVIERGIHDELIAQKGIYEKLYRWQFGI